MTLTEDELFEIRAEEYERGLSHGIRSERARLTAQIKRLQKAIKYLHKSEHGMTIGEKNQIGLQEGDLDDPS